MGERRLSVVEDLGARSLRNRIQGTDAEQLFYRDLSLKRTVLKNQLSLCFQRTYGGREVWSWMGYGTY